MSNRHNIKIFTGNKGKYRDAKLAIESVNVPNSTLQIDMVDDIDPTEIQHLDCTEVAKDKFIKMRNSVPIYLWPLQTIITEDTGLYIGEYMNGFPGAFVKFMIETMGVDGMQKAYAGTHTVFKSTIVASVNGKQYIFENSTKGQISNRPPSGDNGFGFDSIFIPLSIIASTVNGSNNSNASDDIDASTINFDNTYLKTLSEMTHEERLQWSPRSRGYVQVSKLL